MTLFSKVKWVLGVLIVFVLIIATNLIDRENFSHMKDSVVSIYEDRLIAKSLIYDLSKALQEKELAFVTSNTNFYTTENIKVNKEIDVLIGRFGETGLTKTERKVLQDLIENFEKLKVSEKVCVESEFTITEQTRNLLAVVEVNLDDLSKIQMSEGRRQMAISQKAIDVVELFTQIEIYLLIFLAVAIQLVIIYQPKKSKAS